MSGWSVAARASTLWRLAEGQIDCATSIRRQGRRHSADRRDRRGSYLPNRTELTVKGVPAADPIAGRAKAVRNLRVRWADTGFTRTANSPAMRDQFHARWGATSAPSRSRQGHSRTSSSAWTAWCARPAAPGRSFGYSKRVCKRPNSCASAAVSAASRAPCSPRAAHRRDRNIGGE